MNSSKLLTIAAFAAMIVGAVVLTGCSNKKTNVYAPNSGSVIRPSQPKYGGVTTSPTVRHNRGPGSGSGIGPGGIRR